MPRVYKVGDRVRLRHPPNWEGEVLDVAHTKPLIRVYWDRAGEPDEPSPPQKKATSGWIPNGQVVPCDAVSRLGDLVEEDLSAS